MKTTEATTTSFKKMLAKLKKFSIENWGFPFISAFLILLFVAAVLLASGSAIGSQDLANYADVATIIAYFSLLIGVILQIICFSRNGKNGRAASISES
ncbi:MAG TPA: hypothetical protein VK253_07425 [Candidatus Binatia bacterium]|nr:hypothetical protein [Candidatus Binatia bacterium]